MEQLRLFESLEEQELSRSERIAVECVERGEPFFVLRAKDIFAVMAVRNYEKLVEEYGPLDLEFHEQIAEIAAEIGIPRVNAINRLTTFAVSRIQVLNFHLDSGTQRKRAHEFYRREGIDMTGFHFRRLL